MSNAAVLLPHPSTLRRTTALALLLCATALSACGSDHPTSTIAASGKLGAMALEDDTFDDAIGIAASAKELSVTLRNSAGVPMAGVRVTWRADDHGFVTPPVSVTDDLGRATAHWTFGRDAFVSGVTASASGYGTITIGKQPSPMKPLVLNEFRELRLVTYDGSGQTVHPDVVRVMTASLSGNFLAITPYAFGQSSLENPVVYLSGDLMRWRSPAASLNPLVRPSEIHLSDPDIVYDPIRAELMLYYRQVGAVSNSILLIRSTDGVKWTDPVLVAQAPNHQIVSPSVVRRDAGRWLMWAVNGNSGCSSDSAQVTLRHSSDGLVWSDAEPVSLQQPGYFPWHIDVQWIPARNEYWAVYNVKTPGSCSTTALYLATSPDGVTWRTYPSPVVSRGATPPLADIVYRSTFAYDAATDNVTFWFSGAKYVGDYEWGTVVQEVTASGLLARIRMPARVAARGPRSVPPPLIDPP